MALEPDTVYIALTRPATKFGVSLGWLIIEILIPLLAVVWLQFVIGAVALWFLFLVPLLHAIGFLAYRWDPHFLAILATRMTVGWAPLSQYWRRNAYEPPHT